MRGGGGVVRKTPRTPNNAYETHASCGAASRMNNLLIRRERHNSRQGNNNKIRKEKHGDGVNIPCIVTLKAAITIRIRRAGRGTLLQKCETVSQEKKPEENCEK